MLDFKSNEGVDDQFIITFENVRTNNACELVQTLFSPPQRKAVWVATLALVINKNIHCKNRGVKITPWCHSDRCRDYTSV